MFCQNYIVIGRGSEKCGDFSVFRNLGDYGFCQQSSHFFIVKGYVKICIGIHDGTVIGNDFDTLVLGFFYGGDQCLVFSVYGDDHQDIDVYRDIEVTKEGMELWRLYESQTSDLSTRLCEQLRILLEPLQSSKLSGDYKTGKRINMRKIIPFIASNYKKDKIWLRRTKPSKREYNILIALDDSISMKENGGGVIGLQTMALISKALTQVCFYDMILSVLVGSGSVGRLLVR